MRGSSKVYGVDLAIANSTAPPAARNVNHPRAHVPFDACTWPFATRRALAPIMWPKK
jgi:hypothetical protein